MAPPGPSCPEKTPSYRQHGLHQRGSMGALCGGRQAVRCADQRASTPGSNSRRAQIRKRSLPVVARHLMSGDRPSTPAGPKYGTQPWQPSQPRPLTSDGPLPESPWQEPFTSDGWLLAQLHRPHTSGARPAFSHTRTSHPPRPLTSHGCPIGENSSELAESSRQNVPDLPISILPAASDDDWASNVLAALSSRPNSGRPNSGRSSGRKKKPAKTWRERLPTYWIGCSSLPVAQKLALYDVVPDVIPDVEEITGWRKVGAQALSEVLLPQVKNAFRCLGPYEVQCEDLPTALQHMGFYIVDDKAVDKITKTISTYSTLNFEEFMRLADGYAAHDWAKFQTTFKEHDDDGTGQLCFHRVLEVMASQGIMPLRSTLDEMLGRLDRDKSGRFDIQEVAHLMASFRATEGFSSREVDIVYKIFNSLATSGGVSNSCPVMKSTELLPGLLQVFGLHCARHAKKLVELFVAKTDMCALVEFRFFLALARRLREIEVNDYRVAFNLADHDGDSRVSPAEASDVLLPHFGYTPLRVVLDEVLTETGLSWDQPLDFDNFVCFSRVIRHRDGFLEGELEEYVKLFNQFDVDNSNAIDGHELRRILRQLGHQVSLSDVRALLKAVDGNSDGVLSFEELLQLLRLHRESELKLARNAFRQRTKNDSIQFAELKPALALLGHKPTNATFEHILTSVESRTTWSFGNFVGILDKCRRACAEESCKRAGWSDSEFEFLCHRFKKCCGKVEGILTKGELLWILMDLGIKMKTSAARNNIVSKVPEAWALALKAGVNECNGAAHGDSTVTVWVLAHLLRLLARGGEEEEEREILAREETKFSHAEIVEFSAVFAKLINESNAECDSSGPSHDQRRNSAPALEVGQTCHSARPMETLLVPLMASKSQSEAEGAILRSLSGMQSDVPKLPISALRDLLNSFGAKVSLEENQLLSRKVLELGEGRGQLDFSDFLRVMRWMLDTNFADINAKAKEVAGQTASVFQKSLGGA